MYQVDLIGPQIENTIYGDPDTTQDKRAYLDITVRPDDREIEISYNMSYPSSHPVNGPDTVTIWGDAVGQIIFDAAGLEKIRKALAEHSDGRSLEQILELARRASDKIGWHAPYIGSDLHAKHQADAAAVDEFKDAFEDQGIEGNHRPDAVENAWDKVIHQIWNLERPPDLEAGESLFDDYARSYLIEMMSEFIRKEERDRCRPELRAYRKPHERAKRMGLDGFQRFFGEKSDNWARQSVSELVDDPELLTEILASRPALLEAPIKAGAGNMKRMLAGVIVNAVQAEYPVDTLVREAMALSKSLDWKTREETPNALQWVFRRDYQHERREHYRRKLKGTAWEKRIEERFGRAVSENVIEA